MTDLPSQEPQQAGRRSRPHGDEAVPGGAPRRATAQPLRSATTPRRAHDAQDPDVGRRWWLQRGWWAVAAAVIVLLALVISVVWLPSGGTSTPTIAVPVSSEAIATPSPETSTVSPSSEGPDPTSSPASASAQETAPPLPGAAPSSVVSVPADTEPPPTAAVPAGDIELNDAAFEAPSGWILYGDDLIEGSRRAVRLSQDGTDVRLQAVTLEPSEQGLGAACSALVDLQQAQFTEVERQLVAPIGVDAGLGSAVRCGFDGIRTSDAVPNTVAFTLITRSSDSHVLMLRTTVPSQPSGEPAPLAQLNAMICGASTSFGVPLPLC